MRAYLMLYFQYIGQKTVKCWSSIDVLRP